MATVTPHLRLLSLDGGGVRGLASLYMLKQLLSHFGDEKPCNFFDMISGTSTGGLIAIMLGCLEMSVDECIEAFIELMSTIFKREHRLPFSLTSGKVQPRYSTSELEDAIKQVIKRKGLPADALMRRDPQPKCRTFVVALSGENRQHITHFTNYAKPDEQSDFYNKIKIWQAARATSAATSFFAPIGIDGSTFWDGGLGANNPVDRLWMEARSAFGPTPLEPQIRCVLSVGTGKPAPSEFGTTVTAISKSLLDIATATETKASEFYENHEDLANRDGYFRFNPPYLDEIGIADATKRALIRERTEFYGNDNLSVKPLIRRFQAVAGKEPKRVALRSNPRPTPLRIFYDLGKQSDHIRRDGVQSYWQHLTLSSYKVYERIAFDCQKRSDHRHGKVYFTAFLQVFNLTSPSPKRVAEVWTRLLRNAIDVRTSKHPVSFVMAVLYMLHIELFMPNERPPDLGGPTEDRREALKRYDRWISCRCKHGCGKEWNFANDIGLSRGGSDEKTCEIEKYLRRSDIRNLFASKQEDMIEKMRKEWKTPRLYKN